jgi:hypothetical protein
LLNAVSASEAKFAVQSPDFKCKLCFEHFRNPCFWIRKTTDYLVDSAAGVVGREAFVFFVDKSSQLPVC